MKKNIGYVNSGYDMKKKIWKIDFNVVEFKEKKKKRKLINVVKFKGKRKKQKLILTL